MKPTIALLTDFGIQDTFVGVMKGVIAGIAPEARVIDVTHGVPPGDIRHAAFKLWQSAPYFGAGTVFVVVVDPGVGTPRRAIAARIEDRTYVLPDNGLLTYLVAHDPPVSAVELTESAFHYEPVSTSFHGRDIFAPVGAHLASGVDLSDLGAAIDGLLRFDHPVLQKSDPGTIQGEVVLADRFGNLMTSLGRFTAAGAALDLDPWLPGMEPTQLDREGVHVQLPDGAALRLVETFGNVPQGEALCYIGSEGLIEIAVNRGNAAETLALAPGASVELIYEA